MVRPHDCRILRPICALAGPQGGCKLAQQDSAVTTDSAIAPSLLLNAADNNAKTYSICPIKE